MHLLILKEHIIAQIHVMQLMLLHSEEVMTFNKEYKSSEMHNERLK